MYFCYLICNVKQNLQFASKDSEKACPGVSENVKNVLIYWNYFGTMCDNYINFLQTIELH